MLSDKKNVNMVLQTMDHSVYHHTAFLCPSELFNYLAWVIFNRKVTVRLLYDQSAPSHIYTTKTDIITLDHSYEVTNHKGV